MKIASVKDFHRRYDKQEKLHSPTRVGQISDTVKLAEKEGYAFHRDGRAYIPEANRGRGVGYGKHGK